MTSSKKISIALAMLMLTTLACGIDLGDFGSSSDAEETLQAIYIQQTVDAMDESEAPAEEADPQQPTSTIEVQHSTIPGEPGWVSQWWLDTDSSSTAGQKRANGGDNLSVNLLERSFTAQEMDYRPDIDLGRVELSQDNTFYYFILHLNGVQSETNMLSAWYGVELDLDRDSRGDLLLWAKGDGSTQWNIADVYVYKDANDDVGSTRPMQPDTPNSALDGYEQALFSPENLSDPTQPGSGLILPTPV